MPITHEFTWVAPEGQSFVSFETWKMRQTAEVQAAISAAQAKQQAVTASQKNAGALYTTNEFKTVWNDDAETSPYVTQDPEWSEFFDQYLAETGMTVQRTVTKS
jgi:hypothetical protein